MTNLLEIRENIKGFYGRFEIYITPVIKFLIMLITLTLINGKTGYMTRLASPTMVLLVSLVSSILPYNFMLIGAAAFIVIHLYKFSLECAIVVLVLFVLLFLLYFRFASGDGILVMLTPVCCMLHIPLVIPVSAGLLCGPASAVSVCCGVTIYNILSYIEDNESAISSLDAENTVQKYRLVVDGIINNKSMLVMAAALGITVVVVYMIRRLSADYSWMIAIVTGLILPLAILLVGDLIVGAEFNLLPWILGGIVSFFILVVLQFFVFSVDYQRTERVQFEDDEYYYYVKAVPKMTVSRAEKTVKKITPHSGFGYDRSESALKKYGKSQSAASQGSRPSSARQSALASNQTGKDTAARRPRTADSTVTRPRTSDSSAARQRAAESPAARPRTAENPVTRPRTTDSAALRTRSTDSLGARPRSADNPASKLRSTGSLTPNTRTNDNTASRPRQRTGLGSSESKTMR